MVLIFNRLGKECAWSVVGIQAHAFNSCNLILIQNKYCSPIWTCTTRLISFHEPGMLSRTSKVKVPNNVRYSENINYRVIHVGHPIRCKDYYKL